MKKLKIRIGIIATSVVIIIFLIWNNTFDRVKDILNNIDIYKENIVRLKGAPLSSFSLPFTGSLYKLTDQTGSIWVISKIDTVEKTSSIYITGKVKTHIDVDSVLDEKLKQYNLKIDNFGPIIIEIQRDDFWNTIGNIFKFNN
ncbi:hypothetical protein HZA55_01400 [Candidatus Poribacteria bacterium]|nr:hypothetical protein [Candidatus Poribacteria bacterium]